MTKSYARNRLCLPLRLSAYGVPVDDRIRKQTSNALWGAALLRAFVSTGLPVQALHRQLRAEVR